MGKRGLALVVGREGWGTPVLRCWRMGEGWGLNGKWLMTWVFVIICSIFVEEVIVVGLVVGGG